MKITTKILLGMVITAAFVFTIFSIIALQYDQAKYLKITKNELTAIANIQEKRVEQFLKSIEDKLRIISNNKELQDLIYKDKFQHLDIYHNEIKRNILNVQNAVDVIKDLTLIRIDGKVLGSTTGEFTKYIQNNIPKSIENMQKISVANDILYDKNNDIRILSRAPIYVEGKLEAIVYLFTSTDKLEGITSDYTGLGKSGETLIASRTLEGALFLTNRRFTSTKVIEQELKKDNNIPIFRALNNEIDFFEGFKDYRGNDVYSATQYITRADWGIVVKIDKDEISSAHSKGLKDLYIMLAFVFPIILIISLYISRNLSKPIFNLTKIVQDYLKGDYSKKADETDSSEIGALAKSFNQMTSELLGSQETLNEAQNISKMGSWEYDVQNKEMKLSEQLCLLIEIGVHQNKLSLDDYLKYVHPSDIEALQNMYSSSIQQGEKFEVEYRLITSNNNLKFFIQSANLRKDHNGNVVKLVGAVRDVTNERIQAKELNDNFQLVDENIIMSATDLYGRITYTSEAFCEISEFSEEELLGNTHRIVKHEDNNPEVYIDLWKTISSGQQWSGEIKNKTKSGGFYWVKATISPRYDIENKHVGYIAVRQDITDKKVIEETQLELQTAKENAEQAAIAKGAFVANMSHEIRTPMNAILGFTDLALQNKDLPKSVKKYLEKSRLSAKGLLQIINDILDFSKIESKKLTVENICFSIKPLLVEIIDILEFSAKQKNIDLNLNVEQLGDCYIGDPYRIKQVLINIIGNAIKFTNEGSVTLNVGVLHGEVILKVTDTGIGMNKEQLDKIFEAFTQADDSTVRKFGGTGLGTVISKELVERMGGTIVATSELNVGSVFTITLPLEETTCSSNCVYVSEDGLENVAVDTKRVFNILLAEDNELNAELVQLNLGDNLGNTITWTKDGQEVLDEYKNNSNKYDVILMDIHMPNLDGLEACQKIREFEKDKDLHIPIIALTASVTREEKESTFEAGMDGFALKPIILNELLAEIENVVPKERGSTKTIIEKNNSTDSLDCENSKILASIANVKEGFKVWQNEKNYIKALVRFTKHHHVDIQKLQKAFDENNEEDAKLITHTLKGITLGIENFQNIAQELHDEIKDGNISNLTIDSLEEEFNKICDVVNNLVLEDEESDTEILGDEELVNLINKILNDLKEGELDDEEFEVLLASLKKDSSSKEIDSLEIYVDQFEYDQAIIHLTNIKKGK